MAARNKKNNKLEIQYWNLDDALKKKWAKNAKRHDIPLLIASFVRYGFRDPIGYDKTLKAFVEGNGRAEALATMRDQGVAPPRGIQLENPRNPRSWLVPILVGNDAATIAEATGYAIDHNNITVATGNTPEHEFARLWDDGIVSIVDSLNDDAKPLTLKIVDLSENIIDWSGMPEYEHEDMTPFRSLAVHFKDQDGVDSFEKLIGQQLTPKTRYIWHPPVERDRNVDRRYVDGDK